MKAKKGSAGYIRVKKKREGLKTAISFGLVLLLVGFGYWQTKTRLNYFTLIAVLGCLPAAKTMVGWIMLLPRHSIQKELAVEIREKAALLTKAFDLVLTTNDQVMPIDVVILYNNNVCGYTSNEKVDTAYAATHIKTMLESNGYSKITVKIFSDYHAFLTRAEGMNNMASVDRADTKKKEYEMKQIILNISL